MQVDHIGYVVKDIEKSVKEFENIGYEKCSILFFDDKRKVNIQFMKNGDYKVELIQALDDTSDAYAYYKRIRNGPYHICYRVRDIDSSINDLKEKGYTLLKEKDDAIAFSNKKVAFLFKDSMGLIELVEN